MNFSLKMLLQRVELTQLLCAINHTTEILQRRLLVLQIWAWSTILRKITDSPNMGTVNHATEDLQ